MTTNANPFVGLRPFESGEDVLFFGREEQVLELLQRLHRHHFVSVIGSSGSGKSSLIRAGLIPSLEAGYLVNDRDRWLIASMKPGQSPLYNLAAALLEKVPAKSLTPEALVEQMAEEGADALLRHLSPLWDKGFNLFLLVDQFEELFRFCLDQKATAKRDEATDFVNILLELSQQKGLPIYIVTTMRSDFIGDCTQFFGLPEALNQSQYLVPRLTRTQLKTTIEGPVRLFKRKVSPSLTARLLNDTQSVNDELPLLQHALMRTWEFEVNRNKSGQLDIGDYESIGGIEKALSNHADEALAALPDDEKALAKKIFQALTATDDNGRKIRRPATLGELESITGANNDRILSVVNRFIEGNRSFIVINKTGAKKEWLIDISHESLIRQWGTLNAWVEEEAESAKAYGRLTESALLYGTQKKDLLGGSELQLALQWFNDFRPAPVWAERYNSHFTNSIGYLNQSEAAWKEGVAKAKMGRRNRRLLFGGLVVLLMGALFVYSQQKVAAADQQRTAAKQADSLRKIAQSAAAEAAVQRDSARYALRLAEAAIDDAGRSSMAEHLAVSKTREALARLQRQTAKLVQSERLAKRNELAAFHAKQETEKQNEAFQLVLKAQQTADTDPNQALQMGIEALQKASNPFIKSAVERLYMQTAFYQNQSINLGYNSNPVYLPKSDAFFTSGINLYGGYTNFFAAVRPPNNNVTKALNRYEKNSAPLNHQYLKSQSLAHSENGNTILAAVGDSAFVFDLTSDQKIERFSDTAFIQAAALSPDGQKILTGSRTGVVLRSRNGKQLQRLAKADSVRFVSFSPDGKQMLAAFANATFGIWDGNGVSLLNGKLKAPLDTAVFSPTGNAVLVRDRDSLSYLYRFDDFAVKGFALVPKTGAMAFAPDGQSFLVSSRRSPVRLWKVDDSVAKVDFNGHSDMVRTLAYSPDGSNVVTGADDKTVRLWSLDGEPISVLKAYASTISLVDFSQNGQEVISVSYDGEVKRWEVPVTEFKGHDDAINLVATSPNGTKILTGSADYSVRLWNPTGVKLFMRRFDDQVSSVAFSADGKRAALSAGNSAWLWTVGDTLFKEFAGHVNTVQTIAFSPDGEYLVTGSDDHKAILWDIKTATPLVTVKQDSGVVTASFSKDGSKVAVGDRKGTIQIFAVSKMSGETMLVAEKPSVFRHNGIVNCVAFSPSGQTLLSGSADNTACLWTLTGQKIATLSFNNVIESVSFSPDGKKMAVGAWDGTVKIMDAKGAILWTYTLPAKVRSLTFTADSKKIFVGCGDGIGRMLWAMSPEAFFKR